MAILYCVEGTAFNGDGSSPALAAAPGGVGAFNSSLNCLTGIEPGVSDGDTVIFKTTQSDNSSNIVVNYSASLTFVGAVVGLTRTYIMDDGTVWPGAGGVLVYNTAVAGANIILAAGCALLADGRNYRFEQGNNSTGTVQILLLIGSYFDGILLRQLDTTTGYNASALSTAYGVIGDFGAAKLVLTKLPGNASINVFYSSQGKSLQSFTCLECEFTAPTLGGSAASLINSGNFECSLSIGYMSLINVPDTMLLTKNVTKYSKISISNMYVDNINYQFRNNVDLTSIFIDNLVWNGVGAENYNFIYQRMSITTSFLSNRNYPTLSAFLPDLVNQWSVKIDMSQLIKAGVSRKTWQMVDLYDQTSGIKTITVEMLIYNALTALTNNNFYINVLYVDSNGIQREETTRNGNLLSSSLAVWNTVGYGALNFNKFKMSLTTKFPIKTGTQIDVSTYSNVTVPDAQTFNFINPEIILT